MLVTSTAQVPMYYPGLHLGRLVEPGEQFEAPDGTVGLFEKVTSKPKPATTSKGNA